MGQQMTNVNTPDKDHPPPPTETANAGGSQNSTRLHERVRGLRQLDRVHRLRAAALPAGVERRRLHAARERQQRTAPNSIAKTGQDRARQDKRTTRDDRKARTGSHGGR